MAASATKYFNCKVNVFSKDEIILLLLLSGVSFEMLKMLCKEGEIKMIGLPRDINEKAFSTNPEILQHKFQIQLEMLRDIYSYRWDEERVSRNYNIGFKCIEDSDSW